MARLKTFDPDAALDRAMDLFWRRGYEATGMQDLVDELGLSRSSLYNTFGGKDQLYLAAFERYCALEAGPRHAMLTREGSVLDGLRELLVSLAEAPEHYPDRRGCLVVNTAMERVPGDPQATAAVEAQLGRLERALLAAVRRGQAQGEIPEERDPLALARFLVSIVQGMRVVGKATGDGAALRDTLEVALAAVSGDEAGA